MTEIELKNFETLKKFHIGDNVMYDSLGTALFGTVTGFELTKDGLIWVDVDIIVIGESIARCIRPDALYVIKFNC